MPMKQLLTVPFAIAVGASAQSAQAAVIQATGASASSEFNSSYVAENTINGSGLSAAGDPNATHGSYQQGNHWTTDFNDVRGETIEWTFDTAFNFGGIWIWNHRSDNIANNPRYEPVLFNLSVSDGSSVLGAWENVDLAPDTNMSQAFTLNAPLSGVTSVLFEVVNTQGGMTPYTGLAEVLFSDATITTAGATVLDADADPEPVPLPATAWLLLGALGVLRLRRRMA